MIFRKATQQDLGGVYALYRSLVGTPMCAWDEYYPGWTQINEDYQHGGLYVTEEGGTIVGVISLVPENELDGLPLWTCTQAREIARVAVAPGHQGKGIAYQMVSALTAQVFQSGVPAIHLLVSEENAPAQRLYRKCGFTFLNRYRMFDLDFLACEKLLRGSSD